MATTRLKKTTSTTNRGSETKKSKTQQEIEKLEKALENVKGDEIKDIMLDDSDIDVLSMIQPATPEPETDVKEEIKDILANPEMSEEVKEQFDEFKKTQDDFEEKLNKEPEKAAQIVEEEIKKVETLKAKAEALKNNLHKATDRNVKNENFTNWWNGSSSLY